MKHQIVNARGIPLSAHFLEKSVIRLQFGNIYFLKISSNLEMSKNWNEEGPENMLDVEKYNIWGS